MVGRVERPFEDRNVAIDADEALDLVAERRQVGRFGDGAVTGPFVLLGQADVEGLVADGHPVAAEEDAEETVELAGDLRQERRHVGGAERDARGADDLAAMFLDRLGIGVARRLAPGVIGIGDVPFLAQLAEIRAEGHGLRRRAVERTERVLVAAAAGDGGVEADADHVDDLMLLPDRHAGEADIGQEPAACDVHIVVDGQLLRLAAPDIGLRFVIGDDQFDRPAVDAARSVDASHRHLRADQRGLAASGTRAGERLQRADLVRLGRRAERRPPRRRHQHRRADHAGAPAHEPTARHLAAVPEIFRPILFVPFPSHCEALPVKFSHRDSCPTAGVLSPESERPTLPFSTGFHSGAIKLSPSSRQQHSGDHPVRDVIWVPWHGRPSVATLAE